jgi:hypothetical protein
MSKKRPQNPRNWRFEGYGLYLRAPFFGIGRLESPPRRHDSKHTEESLAIKWAIFVEALREFVRFLFTGHF